MSPILDGYGVMTFFNSRTRPRVNRVLQLAESLVANFSQLQTVQFPLSRHLVGMRGRWGGLVFAWRCMTQLHNARSSNRAAACVAAGGGIFENQL